MQRENTICVEVVVLSKVFLKRSEVIFKRQTLVGSYLNAGKYS